MADSFKILELKTAVNTAVAGGGTAQEVVISGTDTMPYFNHLEVFNVDVVKITVKLDNDSTKVYTIPQNTSFILDVTEGVHFTGVAQINTSTTTAETAGAILFKAMYKQRVV